MRITIHDLAADSEWFARLGAELRRLKWFQAELASPQKRITNAVTSKRSSASDVQGVTRTRTRASTFAAFSSTTSTTTTSTPLPPPSPHKKTTLERPKSPHHHLLRGLSGLRSLRVLVLKETDYFDGEDRVRSGLYTSPLLDDHSLLEIFRACSHLEALTLATALRRNAPDYHRCEFESRENAAEVNRVLAAIFAEDQLVDQIVPKTGGQTRRQSLLLASTSSSSSSLAASFDNGVSGSRNRALSRKLAKRPPFTRSVSIFGDMFEEGGRQNHSSNSTAEDGSASNEDDDSSDDCNSEGQTSLDSGVGVDLGGGGGGQQDHSSSSSSSSSAVTDCCLATLHLHLPRLRLLQLRGVRLGRPSMDAIASLSRLELLRLDSISFAEEEARDFFTEFISRLTAEGSGGGDGGDGGPSKTNIRITNIPLV